MADLCICAYTKSDLSLYLPDQHASFSGLRIITVASASHTKTDPSHITFTDSLTNTEEEETEDNHTLRQTEIAQGRIEGRSKCEREAEQVELNKQKVIEGAKERLSIELTTLTPENSPKDRSWTNMNRISSIRSLTRHFLNSLDQDKQRSVHSTHYPSTSTPKLPKSSKSVFSDRNMGLMMQKARLELTKCGAGGESVREHTFDDSEEREEAQRQAVKERLKQEKKTLLIETEAENAQERRRRAENLQTDHSRLLNLHNAVVLRPPPSQPDAVANKGLLNDLAQLGRLLLHKQHDTEFLVAPMRDRIWNETPTTNCHTIRASQRVSQTTVQFGGMITNDIVNTFVEQAEMSE
ncbi:hypothetical protein BLNAU_2577 [Blattamonas nauphoetae]|uniref:Pinin/SDK/MemA protein domain-containing protein n=1 Tax=Blattamonas nauphoetae TaxID=2049346 RepID=A0ABQ9YF40_9EUKA|nr:hypothetical protein BLNAU_2577 [Blattamonas nauphoetae]